MSIAVLFLIGKPETTEMSYLRRLVKLIMIY